MTSGSNQVISQGKDSLGGQSPSLVQLILTHESLAVAADIKVQIKVLHTPKDVGSGRSVAAVGIKLEVAAVGVKLEVYHASGIEVVRVRLSSRRPEGKQTSPLAYAALCVSSIYSLYLLSQDDPCCQMGLIFFCSMVVPVQKQRHATIARALSSPSFTIRQHELALFMGAIITESQLDRKYIDVCIRSICRIIY